MMRKLEVVMMCRGVRAGKVMSRSFMGFMESRVRKRVNMSIDS